VSVQEFSPLHLILAVVIVASYVGSIWAVIATITDRRLGLAEKAIWVAELLIFPIVGLLVWLVSWAFRRRQGA
jgi:hypothetical protein